MKRNNALIAVAAVGGFLFLASKAKASDEALKPMVSPLIPGTGGATAATPAAAPGGGMAPSKAAVDLIKKNTGFLPLPKAEPSGAVIIGYGHKVVDGDPVDWKNLALKTPLTPEQADALFLNDLLKHVEVINRLVSVPLNQNQYDALSSLVMNIGAENFAVSTLLKRLNEKDYAGAGEQFLVWNKSRGANNNLVVNDGLTARRAGERTLFLTPVVEVAGAVPPTQAPSLTLQTPPTRSENMTREQHIAAGHREVTVGTPGTRSEYTAWVDSAGNIVAGGMMVP